MRNSETTSKSNSKTNSKNNRKKRKSKLLIRRILIVMALLLILLAIFQGLGFVYRLIANEEKTPEFEPDTGYVISSVTSETTNVESTGIDISQSEASDTETEPSNTETTQTETTQSETTQSETTQSDTTQNETTGEAIHMNFQEISYYLERFKDRYTNYAGQNTSLTTEEVVRDVNMNLDFPFYENVGTSPDLNSVQILCNKYFALPDDFTPRDIVDVPSEYYVNDGKEYRLNEDALNAFISMSDAAKDEGLSLKIISAYRSHSYQERLYEKYKAKSSQAEADRYSARPGHSEHETGFGIDINDVAQAFEKTDEFKWLQENAHLYGYILRYPKGLDYLTGYMYEPWHYRYLGVELATKVFQSGLTYDAYYAMYLLK